MVYFGCTTSCSGLGSFRMPSMTPIAISTSAIPISGVLVALFTMEQMVNGLRNGFAAPTTGRRRDHADADLMIDRKRPHRSG